MSDDTVTNSGTGMDTSQLSWTLMPGVQARPFEPDDAATVYRLIQANRAHLDRWIRWSSTIQSVADAADTIAQFVTRRASGTGFHNGIWVNGQLAGGVVCRDLEPVHRHAEIGYWLGTGFTGRGLAVHAATRAIDYLFGARQLHRIEMQCAVDNVRSRAIPEKLGFTLEGIRRESHWIMTRFADHAVYGMLAGEWARAASALQTQPG
ncbi:MAG: GNAT family N-acetyltransferase [Gemmatimonadales bacterium]